MSPFQDYPNVTLTQLSYAVVLARLQHFGAAARACHVTQPTLSMQIQKLEETLGVILFDRTKKPVMVTDVGRGLIEQAGIVLRETQRIADMVSAARNEVVGEFRLGIIPTLAPYLLPRFLDRFTTRYPGVHLFVNELQTDLILNQLQMGSLDAGLLATPVHHRNLIERPLFYESFLVYLAHNHPLSDQEAIRQEGLRREDIWLLAEGHCLRNQVLNLCGADASVPARSVRFDSGSLETLMRLIDNGAGYTVIPFLAADQITETDRKERLRPFTGAPPTREISLVFSRTFLKAVIIEALQEVIRSSVPAMLLEKPIPGRILPITPERSQPGDKS